MVWPPQNTGIFAYKTPCCECPIDCCYFFGAGTGDGGSATASVPTSTTAALDVTTTNSSPTLALGLTGTIALVFAAGAEVVLTWSTDGFSASAVISGLTPDSSASGTATYTIPSAGCYLINLEADSGPGDWTSMTAGVDITSDLTIDCASLEDQGFTPSEGGGP